MESIRLLVIALLPIIEREHFFTYIIQYTVTQYSSIEYRVLSSLRHCSVYNFVTQFDFQLLIILYTMESNQMLVNTLRPIEREHFFLLIL